MLNQGFGELFKAEIFIIGTTAYSFEEEHEMLLGVVASTVILLKIWNLVTRGIWFRDYPNRIWHLPVYGGC